MPHRWAGHILNVPGHLGDLEKYVFWKLRIKPQMLYRWQNRLSPHRDDQVRTIIIDSNKIKRIKRYLYPTVILDRFDSIYRQSINGLDAKSRCFPKKKNTSQRENRCRECQIFF